MSKGLEAWKYTRENYLQLKKEKYSKCEDVNNILERCNKRCDIIEQELKEYEKMKTIRGTTTFDKAIEDTLINSCPNVAKKLKALEILSEHIIINEKNGYVEFFCDFSLPTNSDYENEEHFKEKIDLLKEVLL